MQRVLLILLIFIFSLECSASEVWVTTPTPVSRERLEEITEKYRALIKDADIVAVYDFLLGHPVRESQMAVILDLDSIARAASLNGNFKKALDYYLKLSGVLKTLPNVSGLEKITLSTRINIAHMSSMLKIKDAENLWTEAHAWAPDANLSPEEFSPAVILRFSKPTKLAKRQKVQIRTAAGSILFVDGQHIKPADSTVKTNYSLFLEPGNHQVSTLAHGMNWAISNFKVGTKEVSLRVIPTPFIKGSCEDPQIASQDIPSKIKLLAVYSDDCPRVFSDNNWYTIEGTKLVTTERMSPAPLSNNLKPGPSSTVETAAPDKRSFLGKLTGSGLFWAGVGAVILGAIVISSSQTTTVPTHTMQ